MNTPQPCTEDQFINAHASPNAFGWRCAGNGESYKVQNQDSLTVYARTGKRHWTFTTTEPMNHASIMASVRSVIAQERDDLLETV